MVTFCGVHDLDSNKSAKKLFICLSTHVFKRHTSIRVSKLPASAEEGVEPHLIPCSAETTSFTHEITKSTQKLTRFEDVYKIAENLNYESS